MINHRIAFKILILSLKSDGNWTFPTPEVTSLSLLDNDCSVEILETLFDTTSIFSLPSLTSSVFYFSGSNLKVIFLPGFLTITRSANGTIAVILDVRFSFTFLESRWFSFSSPSKHTASNLSRNCKVSILPIYNIEENIFAMHFKLILRLGLGLDWLND